MPSGRDLLGMHKAIDLTLDWVAWGSVNCMIPLIIIGLAATILLALEMIKKKKRPLYFPELQFKNYIYLNK